LTLVEHLQNLLTSMLVYAWKDF